MHNCLKRNKKILSTLIKILIGFGSFGIICMRLETDLTAERLQLLSEAARAGGSVAAIFTGLLLIPVNWGIEAYKWQIITAPVHKVNYLTASKSVYSGVCLGNLAPGRATEFMAKIIYFPAETRPGIAVLHFISGMFQLGITLWCGLAAFLLFFHNFAEQTEWIIWTTGISAIVLIAALVLCICNINKLLDAASKKFSADRNAPLVNYHFSTTLLVQLFSFSLIRYFIFYCQFALALSIFYKGNFTLPVFSGIALYFLITTALPMISIFEPAVRAAVALIVFSNTDISSAAVALSSVIIWLANIIIPSIAGYYFLLQQNFNFKLFRYSK